MCSTHGRNVSGEQQAPVVHYVCISVQCIQSEASPQLNAALKMALTQSKEAAVKVRFARTSHHELSRHDAAMESTACKRVMRFIQSTAQGFHTHSLEQGPAPPPQQPYQAHDEQRCQHPRHNRSSWHIGRCGMLWCRCALRRRQQRRRVNAGAA